MDKELQAILRKVFHSHATETSQRIGTHKVNTAGNGLAFEGTPVLVANDMIWEDAQKTIQAMCHASVEYAKAKNIHPSSVSGTLENLIEQYLDYCIKKEGKEVGDVKSRLQGFIVSSIAETKNGMVEGKLVYRHLSAFDALKETLLKDMPKNVILAASGAVVGFLVKMFLG
ncbi:hypothetical protein [Terasakiella pusilla]|uniref:hypothetical protein n=1 Tax=Terasakiella pusilla TaxID=64973 RepID=UPI003AA8D643